MKSMQARLERAVQILIYLAICGLVIRIGIIKPYTLQPFEFFIILAALVTSISWVFFGMNARWKMILSSSMSWFIFILLLLGIGTLIGITNYPADKESYVAIVKDFFYIITIFCAYLLIRYHAVNDGFRKKAMISFLIPVGFSIFLLSDNLAAKLELIGDQYTFIGFSGNQTILATSLIIPLSFFWHTILYLRLETYKQALYWIAATATSAIMLWTGSRGAIVASMLVIIGYYIHSICVNRFNWKRVISLMLILLLSAALSFEVLPRPSKIMLLDRIFPRITNYEPSPEKLTTTTVNSAITAIVSKPETQFPNPKEEGIIPYQNRANLWYSGVQLAIQNIFGLGPEYARLSKTIHEPDGRWAPAHNTLIQIFLSGGFGLVIIIGTLLFLLIKKFREATYSTELVLYSGICFGFFFIMLFNDYLYTVPCIWILIALLISQFQEKKQE